MKSDARCQVKQPSGLYMLFATEMWERFSFYAMRALLVLYMTAAITQGGLEFSTEFALKIYSFYLGFAYVMPVIGGILADRYLGQRKAVLLGGWLMMIGHALMAVNQEAIFFTAIFCVALGNGFFKPNVTSILGCLYTNNDDRRDGGYAIFYMGINVGGVLSGLVSGTLMQRFGFDHGFAAAAVGMAFSLLVFSFWGKRCLGNVGLKPCKHEEKPEDNLPLTSVDFDRMKVIAALALSLTVFIMAFEQLGGLLNIFADKWVDRHIGTCLIPTAFFQSLNPMFIVLLSPLASKLWVKLGDKNPFATVKVALGLLFTSCSFAMMYVIAPTDLQATAQIHWAWLVLQNFLTTSGELCILPVIWSNVSKLAPSRHLSTLMALSMISIGVGSWASGQIGALVSTIGFQGVFGSLAFSCVITAVILIVTTPLFKRLSHGVR